MEQVWYVYIVVVIILFHCNLKLYFIFFYIIFPIDLVAYFARWWMWP